jgi:hypothetical protein
MWSKKLPILLIVTAFGCVSALAQEATVKKDTTRIYKDIESYSKRSKFNTFLYRLIFKPVSIISKKEVKKKVYKKLIQKPYSTYQGKIIRTIRIVTLDPFNYTANDTSSIKEKGLIKFGNGLHIKTRQKEIRNLLLIKENEPFNSYFVKESERLIRNQKFVHDVAFFVAQTGTKPDSVDITIRELDQWSINPRISVSTSAMKLGLTDKNFLGTGDEFLNIFSRNISNGISAFNSNYFVPNIRTTYINLNIHFGIDGYGNIRNSFAFERPFYSPYATWAAGLSYASQVKKDSLNNITPSYVPLNLRYQIQDVWGARAFQIFRGYTDDDRVTNLVFAVRFRRMIYHEKPAEINDPLHIYSNEHFYLASIGISTRKYLQDTYIFRYGTIEDVPVGSVIEVTGGFQSRISSWRPYLGIRFSIGNYNEWGYLSSNINLGTFFRSSHAEQGVITAGINYFTGLFEIGKWKFRQFVKPQITIGIHRFDYDSLTINDRYGLDGFNSPTLSGTNRMLLTLQTQSYSPWNLAGFHFGPFLVCSFGMLGDAASGFSNKRLYSQLGFGILIKNENLVFNSFQVSVSFFPSIPGNGQNIFKMNSFTTSDFGFRDFEIGKPVPVMYR